MMMMIYFYSLIFQCILSNNDVLLYRQLSTNSLLFARCHTGAQIEDVHLANLFHQVDDYNGQQAVYVASNPPLMITAPKGYVQALQIVCDNDDQ